MLFGEPEKCKLSPLLINRKSSVYKETGLQGSVLGPYLSLLNKEGVHFPNYFSDPDYRFDQCPDVKNIFNSS